MTGRLDPPQQVLTTEDLLAFQRRTDAVYVDPAVIEYAVRLAGATRAPAVVGLPDLARYLSFGASPRASINLVKTAKALAFLRGRDYALPLDARDLALDVLRHRVVLSYEALADGLGADALLQPVIDAIPVPDVPLREGRTWTTQHR